MEDITHTNRMILDKGKEQIKNLERIKVYKIIGRCSRLIILLFKLFHKVVF